MKKAGISTTGNLAALPLKKSVPNHTRAKIKSWSCQDQGAEGTQGTQKGTAAACLKEMRNNSTADFKLPLELFLYRLHCLNTCLLPAAVAITLIACALLPGQDTNGDWEGSRPQSTTTSPALHHTLLLDPGSGSTVRASPDTDDTGLLVNELQQ